MSRLFYNMDLSMLGVLHWFFSLGLETLLSLMSNVPVEVEFHGLPLPCWLFLHVIAQSLGKVVCVEHDCFYHA